MRSPRLWIVPLAAWLVLPTVGLSQPDREKAAKSANKVSVELLVGRDGVGFRAQKWAEAFESKGIALTIRSAMFGDKPDVTETKLGSGRHIKAVGQLDPQGRIVFPDQAFTEAEAAKLFKWLEELKAYGPQGNPEGQPLWGLSKTQFGLLHTALSAAVEKDLREQPLETALKAMSLPADYPLAWTSEAKDLLAESDSSDVTQSVKGVSKGTALSAVLNQFKLGFRPRRRSDGKLELQVLPRRAATNLWPPGWPLKKPNLETAPALYQFTPIALSDVELDSVLEAAANQMKLPILIDYAGLAEHKIDLSTVKVSHPSKKAAWILALKDLTFQAKTRPDLWIDEAGHPFLWITPVNSPKRPGSDPPIAPPGKNVSR